MADDEARLPPGEEDNTAVRKIDRKDWMVLMLTNYNIIYMFGGGVISIIQPSLFSTGSTDDTEQELAIVKQSINHSILSMCASVISIFCLYIEKQDLTNELNNVESNLPDPRKIKSVGSVFTLAALAYFFKVALFNVAQPHKKAIDCWIDKTSAFALTLSIIAAAVNLTNLFFDYDVEQQETI